jgi:hypothetical protein
MSAPSCNILAISEIYTAVPAKGNHDLFQRGLFQTRIVPDSAIVQASRIVENKRASRAAAKIRRLTNIKRFTECGILDMY